MSNSSHNNNLKEETYEESELRRIYEEIEAFEASLLWSIINSEIDEKYNSLFNEAVATTDPIISKFKIEQMKGLSYTKSILTHIKTKIQEEIERSKQ